MTEAAYILVFTQGITADEFKAGSFTEVIVSVEYENIKGSLATKTNEKIAAYNAGRIRIKGFLTGEAVHIYRFLWLITVTPMNGLTYDRLRGY